MQYSEIYEHTRKIMQWLKENYPHNHKFVIDTNCASLIETDKFNVYSEEIVSCANNFAQPPKSIEELIEEHRGEFESEDSFEKFKKSALSFCEFSDFIFRYLNHENPKESNEVTHD